MNWLWCSQSIRTLCHLYQFFKQLISRFFLKWTKFNKIKSGHSKNCLMKGSPPHFISKQKPKLSKRFKPKKKVRIDQKPYKGYQQNNHRDKSTICRHLSLSLSLSLFSPPSLPSSSLLPSISLLVKNFWRLALHNIWHFLQNFARHTRLMEFGVLHKKL